MYAGDTITTDTLMVASPSSPTTTNAIYATPTLSNTTSALWDVPSQSSLKIKNENGDEIEITYQMMKRLLQLIEREFPEDSL